MAEQLGLFAGTAPAAPTLRALSLWQPWAYAITHLGKRIDNRPWKPWASIVGKRIALHAALGHGTAEDFASAATFIRRVHGADLMIDPHRTTALAQRGKIVGTAVVTGCVSSSADPWFFGPFGWLLDDVRVLAQPIGCRGMQGLWSVPADVLAQIERQAGR